MVSQVFFASARVRDYQNWWMPKASMLQKMDRVFYYAGLDKLCNGEVALKIHLGEPGDTHYIRPVFASKLVDLIKKEGGVPTIIESSGMGLLANRTTEDKHLEAARRNGFTMETVGAEIRMIDGERGVDPINGSVVAVGMKDFDSMIVLSHVTGHIQAGFGGAIKNIGLGCVTKSGKYRVHYKNRPWIDKKKCTQCDDCVKGCPRDAIQDYEVIDKCFSCGFCLDVCEQNAVQAEFLDPITLTKRIAENASEVLQYISNVGYINLAVDVLPHCDCHPFSDIPMVPDIGVLASLDPVAIDRASIDLVNQAGRTPGSSSDETKEKDENTDKFTSVNPCTGWEDQLKKAGKIGIGSQYYELNKIDGGRGL